MREQKNIISIHLTWKKKFGTFSKWQKTVSLFSYFSTRSDTVILNWIFSENNNCNFSCYKNVIFIRCQKICPTYTHTLKTAGMKMVKFFPICVTIAVNVFIATPRSSGDVSMTRINGWTIHAAYSRRSTESHSLVNVSNAALRQKMKVMCGEKAKTWETIFYLSLY